MRKGEISKLTWDMLDRSGTVWVLRIRGAITKNRSPRALALAGAVRAVIDRRMQARRLDCPLIFHRVLKGKPGQPIQDIRRTWDKALEDAGLPPGRIFHDLRRSAVRTLIRSGVDPSIAMSVSGHKIRSMLDRYNIVGEMETAAALLQAEAYLLAQPALVLPGAVGEEGQFRDSGTFTNGQVVDYKGTLGGSGWESNPPLRVLPHSRTALKAARVTRPESLPRHARV